MEASLIELIAVTNLSEKGISKSQVLLEIQANQNDPVIFQTFFCAGCQQFIPANGLFPGPEQHTPGHSLAWVPSLDEPGPGRPAKPITSWLSNQEFSVERRQNLNHTACTSTSLYWGFFLEPEECENWLNYLWSYLDDLAECWLKALNGFDTAYFLASEIWVRPRPAYNFYWSIEDQTD